MALDLEKIHTRLEQKRDELQQSIVGLTEARPTPVDPVEASDGPQDFEEVAVDFLEMQKEQSVQVNQQALLTDVQNALQRLADGAYGTCIQCGRPIPEKRLEAIPWAARDVECEAQLEQQNLSREDVYGESDTF